MELDLSLQNLYDISITDYDENQDYEIGKIVYLNGVFRRAIANIPKNTPITDSSKWKIINQPFFEADRETRERLQNDPFWTGKQFLCIDYLTKSVLMHVSTSNQYVTYHGQYGDDAVPPTPSDGDIFIGKFGIYQYDAMPNYWKIITTERFLSTYSLPIGEQTAGKIYGDSFKLYREHNTNGSISLMARNLGISDITVQFRQGYTDTQTFKIPAGSIKKLQSFASRNFNTIVYDLIIPEQDIIISREIGRLADNIFIFKMQTYNIQKLLDKKLNVSDLPATINDLNSNNTEDSLSAYQGKVLDNKKVDKITGKALSSNDFTDTYKEKIDNIPNDLSGTLDTKVNKVTGKTLSSNDYTNIDKNKVDNLASTYSLIGHSHTSADISDLNTLLGQKVDKVLGKELSSNDYSDTDKSKVDNLSSTYALIAHTHEISEINNLQNNLNNKVDKEIGKGLSSNDFTDEIKQKIENFANSSTVNIHYEPLIHSNSDLLALSPNADDAWFIGTSFDTYVAGDIIIWTGTKWFVAPRDGTSSDLFSKTKDTSDNITEGGSNLFLTADERTKINNISSDITNATTGKVDKITGKGLSSNDYTSIDKAKIDSLSTTYSPISHNHTITQITDLRTELDNRVLSVSGKSLSSNDFTDVYKNKIDNLSSNYSDINHTHNISDVANLQSSLNTKVDKVTGKVLSSNDYTDSDKIKVDNFPSDLTTQLSNKANVSHTHPISDIDELETKINTINSNHIDLENDVNTIENTVSNLNNISISQNARLTSVEDNKVDKIPNKGLSSEDYTSEDKAKISNLDSTYAKLAHIHTKDNITGLINDLNTKVDKVDGKTLSTNDYTEIDKNKVDSLAYTYAEISHTHNLSDTAGLQDAISSKVSKVNGKELSSNDYTDIDKNKVDNLASTYAQINHTHEISNINDLSESLNGKVSKETGKGLSSNNYTDLDKNKLYDIVNKTNFSVTKMEDYIKNEKRIQLFGDVSEFSGVGMSKDSSNFIQEFGMETGEPCSIKLESLSDGFYTAHMYRVFTNPIELNKIGLDPSRRKEGISGNDDYICLVCYVENRNPVEYISIILGTTSEGDSMKKNITTGINDGWNFFKIKKSEFQIMGSGNFDSISFLKIEVLFNSGFGNFISFQYLGLMKKDESYNYPNIFQTENEGKKFSVLGGFFVPIKSFNGIIISQIDHSNTGYNQLNSTDYFYGDIEISAMKLVFPSEDIHDGYVGIRYDSDNYMYAYIYGNYVKIKEKKDGNFTTYSQELTRGIASGLVTYLLVKKSGKLNCFIYDNNELIGEISHDCDFNSYTIGFGNRSNGSNFFDFSVIGHNESANLLNFEERTHLMLLRGEIIGANLKDLVIDNVEKMKKVPELDDDRKIAQSFLPISETTNLGCVRTSKDIPSGAKTVPVYSTTNGTLRAVIPQPIVQDVITNSKAIGGDIDGYVYGIGADHDITINLNSFDIPSHQASTIMFVNYTNVKVTFVPIGISLNSYKNKRSINGIGSVATVMFDGNEYTLFGTLE